MKIRILEKKWIGPVSVILSGIVWSFSGVLSKGLAWNGLSKTGFRGVIACLMFACFRRSFRVKINKPTVIGALGVVSTSLLYMMALRYTTSANAIVLQYAMPAAVVLLSWVFFKQKPLRRDLFAVLCVMAGVTLCCIQGMSGGGIFGDMLALLSAVTYSVVFLASRMPGAEPMNYTYLGNLFSASLCVFLFLDPNFRVIATPDYPLSRILGDFAVAGCMGLCLGFGYLFFAFGIRRTTPTAAAIFENVEPVLNPIWVYLIIGESPGLLGVLGALVVLVTVSVYSLIPFRGRR